MTLLDRLLATLDPGTAPEIFNQLWDEFLALLRPHVRNELVKRYVHFDDLGRSIAEQNDHDVALPIFLNQAKMLRAMWTQTDSKVVQEARAILLTNYLRALGVHIADDSGNVDSFVADQLKIITPEEKVNMLAFFLDVAWRRASARVFRRIIT